VERAPRHSFADPARRAAAAPEPREPMARAVVDLSPGAVALRPLIQAMRSSRTAVIQRMGIKRTDVSPKVYETYLRLDPAIRAYIAHTKDMTAFLALDAEAQIGFLEALAAVLPMLDTVMQREAQPLAIEGGEAKPEPPSIEELRTRFFVNNRDFINQALRLMMGQAAEFHFPGPVRVTTIRIDSLAALQQPTVPLLTGSNAASGPATDYLMKMGGLADLLGEEAIPVWQGLAQDLAAFATPDKLIEDGLLHCGSLRLDSSGGGRFIDNPGKLADSLQERVRAFMLAFMHANGQYDYLVGQPWFASGEWTVDVEVNFYPNRELTEAGLGLHKDTDSRNLFVSLIFNNTEPTPATEWTQDRQPPNQARTAELARNLPSEVNAVLESARTILGQIDKPGKERFEGGLAPANAYVSWIDELVWHSSPSLARRNMYTKDMVLRYLDDLDKVQFTFDAMCLLTATAGTYLNQQFPNPADFDLEKWNAWYKQYFSPTAALADDTYRNLLLDSIHEFPWTTQYQWGNLGGVLTRELKNTQFPTMVGQRPRRNSDPEVLKDVQEAAQKNPIRSFIRTWVTINRARRRSL